MAKKETCSNHPNRKAARICMGCGKWFCTECLTFVHNIPYCSDCQAVAEDLRGAVQERAEDQPDSVYGEAASGDGPVYAPTGEDAIWEHGFDSSKMVKITRGRLAELERSLSLVEDRAGILARAIAFVIDFAVTAVLALGPFYLEAQGRLSGILPDPNTRFLVLMVNLVLSLFYYRLPLFHFSGVTLGRVVPQIRLVDQKGKFLGFGQAVVYTILQTVMYIPPLFLLNGLVAALSKDRRSLIDKILGTQEVKEGAWHERARKAIYFEDISRLGR